MRFTKISESQKSVVKTRCISPHFSHFCKHYKALDNELDDETKNAIKESNVDDLIKYHFGLGTWIRNNWIYPTTEKIAKVFLDADIAHPDDMSHEIILGYHYYLNNIPYEIKSGS